jgi:hypothetical protein
LRRRYDARLLAEGFVALKPTAAPERGVSIVGLPNRHRLTTAIKLWLLLFGLRGTQ